MNRKEVVNKVVNAKLGIELVTGTAELKLLPITLCVVRLVVYPLKFKLREGLNENLILVYNSEVVFYGCY